MYWASLTEEDNFHTKYEMIDIFFDILSSMTKSWFMFSLLESQNQIDEQKISNWNDVSIYSNFVHRKIHKWL